MFDGRWRSAVDRNTRPLGVGLRRVGVTADVLTAAGLGLACATAVAVGSGHLHLAIILLALTGFADLLDGPVAKASGRASVRGAFFDSVMDRVSDAVVMGGVAWYLTAHHKGQLALLPLAILASTSLISYERAKAEALGIQAKGGLMERAERMILLGVGFLAPWLLVPVLWVMLGLTTATAAGRFVRVWRVAEGPPPVAAHRADARRPSPGARKSEVRPRRRTGMVESRWRAWRQGLPSSAHQTGRRQTLGRWRARRQEAPASRTGRTLRARRSARVRRSGGTAAEARGGHSSRSDHGVGPRRPS